MFELLIIIICILINSLLAGSEAAFISVSKTALKQLAQQGNPQAKVVLNLRENPEKTLSIIQIGITFIGAVAAAVGGAGAEESLAPLITHYLGFKENFSEIIAIALVVVPITFVSVVIGELVPKSIALRQSMYYALKTGPWLAFIGKFINPITTLLEKITKQIICLFPKKNTHFEENSENSLEMNILSAQNQQYIYNIVGIEYLSVENILVPWDQVTVIDEKASLEEVENIIITSGHTRLPVKKEQDVKGILNSKEFLALLKTKENNWHTLIRPALKIEYSDPLLATLRLMQTHRKHMAIVYKNQSVLGVVTLEGIFESIIGDIYDENDEGKITRLLNTAKQ